MKIAILGAGPGGYVSAIKASQSGADVTVIEDREVGGTCLNWGCIPTKAIIASTEALAKARRLEDYGIDMRGEAVPNLLKIIERKNKIVTTQIKGIRNLLKSRGIELVEGRGVLISPRQVTVISKNGQKSTVESDRIILATGSRPSQIPELPFDGRRILSSEDALNLTAIPKTLIIVGAGVIGSEFACIFQELGADVTVVEVMQRALSTEDLEISVLFERECKKKKIKLLTNIKPIKVDIRDETVHLFLNDGREIMAEKILVAAGRLSNSEGIGLENIGIRRGVHGEISVNNKMETSIPGIYAVGDVIGGYMLAHVASREGVVAAINSMGGNEDIDYSSVPSAIFTSPQIASVGLREHQAEEKGISIRTGHFQFRSLAKAHTIGEIEGFVKIISDADSDRVLGVHIIGPHASDLIHEGVLAIRNGITSRNIAETIHAHPTLSEVLMEAAEDIHGEAIHKPKR